MCERTVRWTKYSESYVGFKILHCKQPLFLIPHSSRGVPLGCVCLRVFFSIFNWRCRVVELPEKTCSLLTTICHTRSNTSESAPSRLRLWEFAKLGSTILACRTVFGPYFMHKPCVVRCGQQYYVTNSGTKFPLPTPKIRAVPAPWLPSRRFPNFEIFIKSCRVWIESWLQNKSCVKLQSLSKGDVGIVKR